MDRIKKWWEKQSNTDKAVYGLSAFCVGALIFIAITGSFVPDITYSSLDTNNAQISNSTTEFIVKGQTEPNAQVFISDPDLRLNKTPVKVNSNGSFEYKLTIPIEISDTSVSVISKAPRKYEVSHDVEIQRPLTYLSIKPIGKLDYENKIVELEGQSDPNASICIISNMTLRNNLDLESYIDTAFDDPVINNITLKADSNGHFKYKFYVPLNSTSVYFSITAGTVGKRNITQIQNITREFEVFPPITSIFDINEVSNKSKMKNFTGKGFSISYPSVWQKRSYKNAGKDARLYLIYGNSVECIVWYGKIGREFGNSLEEYKKTQDSYIRAWWGGTEVFEQNISYGDVKGFRIVYKCQQNPVFSNDIPSPFYIDRTTVTKNNVDVYELQLMVSGDYYEKNDYFIENTVGSFLLK
ncbi:MAG: hypothetical protein HZC47_08270 [Methanobacterium sp.]|uniref:hypothetical protein n=1 Tax=Methanobacterium sp. TaxID=2164 RepID=UPI003D65AAEB|nr:hypothetical protein [Methanobacterium sp.]